MNMTFELSILIIYWSTLGLFIGSFLGVVIGRIPKGESIIRGRSRCDFCKRQLRWYELIPVISFLLQKGKCGRCHKKLSWRYPLYEVVTGLIFGVLAFTIGFSVPQLIIASIIASGFLAIFVIDFDHMIIPDILLWITGIVTVLWLLITHDYTSWTQTLLLHISSATLAFSLFYGLWRITKKKGMGYGDVLLVFVIGLLVGYPTIIISLYASFVLGAIVAVVLLIKRKKGMKSAIPFGPFLILGMVLSLCIDSPAIFHLFF